MPSNEIEKTKLAPESKARRMFSRRVWAAMLLLIVGMAMLFFAFRISTRDLMINGHTYRLEEARSDAAHQKGLSGRESLDASSGMLFIYGREQELCFWMKDMHFPIDIIWVDAKKQVVAIEHDVAPETYPENFCHDSATYVIELKAGEAARHGLLTGDKLRF